MKKYRRMKLLVEASAEETVEETVEMSELDSLKS